MLTTSASSRNRRNAVRRYQQEGLGSLQAGRKERGGNRPFLFLGENFVLILLEITNIPFVQRRETNTPFSLMNEKPSERNGKLYFPFPEREEFCSFPCGRRNCSFPHEEWNDLLSRKGKDDSLIFHHENFFPLVLYIRAGEGSISFPSAKKITKFSDRMIKRVFLSLGNKEVSYFSWSWKQSLFSKISGPKETSCQWIVQFLKLSLFQLVSIVLFEF